MVNISDLKCIFSTPTVMKMEKVTSNMVKRRYLPSRGTAKEVGGIISASSKKKTVRERRMEIQSVTCNISVSQLCCRLAILSFSPESAGK